MFLFVFAACDLVLHADGNAFRMSVVASVHSLDLSGRPILATIALLTFLCHHAFLFLALSP